MEPNFFTHLPSEIITCILLKLPLRAISISKCVCKAWLHLLESDAFVSSHPSTSAPTMAMIMFESPTLYSCTLLQFTNDELEYATLTLFRLPHEYAEIKGAANGLLLLSTSEAHEAHLVCNPITRQCAQVPPFPGEPESVCSHPESVVCYGFGVSRVSGEYKVVRVYQISTREAECYVYTLGTGVWMRRVGPGEARFQLSARGSCVFLNGNLHWLVKDAEGGLRIWCFDLETERFSSFSTPPVYRGRCEETDLIAGLSTVKGCLCLRDYNGESYESVIWVMKERWEKENVIKIDDVWLDVQEFEPRVCPVDIFGVGGYNLLVGDDLQVFSSFGWIGMVGEVRAEDFVNAIVLTPSFVSLRGLGMESVELLEGW